MGLFEFLGFLALSVAVAVGVTWYQPSVVDQLARQTGVDGRTGWAAFLVAMVWAFLPVLAGAETGDREQPLRFLETFVPAEEPVTVVGTLRQGEVPGVLVVDEVPDDLLGTDGAAGEAVLVRGDADAAETMLRKRVRWLGPAGLAMVLGGQALSFALSSATLGGLL
ncbi:hypothetical protein BRC63_10765 [Halobacteriales archaeon QH_10_70_21]|nr:MAG: hypothetical protein BRC63_10765 [Halobacteriales archaeon QH_10_70_21]